MNRKLFAVMLITAFTIPLLIVSTSAKNVKNPKILVVYYSKTGNTKQVAEDIAKKLNADIEQIIDLKDRSGTAGYLEAKKDAIAGNLTKIDKIKKNPTDYDCVVIGNPVWYNTITPAIRTYINNNKNSLKIIAYFTTALSSPVDETAPIFEKAAGQKVIASEGFLQKELSIKKKKAYDKKINAFAYRIVKEMKKIPAK
jgi:flavodoxin